MGTESLEGVGMLDGTLSSFWSPAISSNVGEVEGTVLQKQARHKKTNTTQSHFCVDSEKADLTEMEEKEPRDGRREE